MRASGWKTSLVRSGVLGKVTVARASYRSNMATQGIGHAPMTMTTQIRFPFPRFFRNTGASGKCLSSQRVRPQSTNRGATLLASTKSFPCQPSVISLLAALDRSQGRPGDGVGRHRAAVVDRDPGRVDQGVVVEGGVGESRVDLKHVDAEPPPFDADRLGEPA